jgi:hypothetical protein
MVCLAAGEKHADDRSVFLTYLTLERSPRINPLGIFYQDSRDTEDMCVDGIANLGWEAKER